MVTMETTLFNNPGACQKCGHPTGADWKTLCISCWRSRTPEEVRAQRQEKLDRKINRLRQSADRLENVGDSKTSAFRELSKDIAWVTQPNINSSRGRAFKNSRIKVLNRYDAGMRLYNEADEKRQKADWLENTGAVVKGDAERRRQAEREAQDKIIKVGTRITTFLNQSAGTVVKVNKKTYTIKFDQGRQYAIEKTFVDPIK